MERPERSERRKRRKKKEEITASELYEICVGEGGMNPDYFARISLFEAVLFARGVARRYRAGWEQARFSTYITAAPNYKNLSFESLLDLPWEKKKAVSEEEQLAAIEKLRAKIPMYEELLKNKKKDGLARKNAFK